MMRLIRGSWLRNTLLVLGLASVLARAQSIEAKPDDPFFAKFSPTRGPAPAGLVLKAGDRLAICGDSITEQRMYSRIIETYLTVCVPELDVTVRQYGWSGEKADGFLGRMTNDCLRFQPTIATTCYGMNDHGYRVYEESIGKRYREYQTGIVEAFKSAGARVILGSAGCVGKNPPWGSKDPAATMEALNLNLCELRNIDVEIARQEGVGFADVFWPMLTANFTARQKYGEGYALPGKDGVHPGWAGHLVMAYAYLRALGLDGEIGRYTVDLAAGHAMVSKGHELIAFKDGELRVKSARYPFCTPAANLSADDNIRSGMSLVPFNQELNRLTLVVKGASAANYEVTWGDESHRYTAAQLAAGINLAEDFVKNPFSGPFAKVDDAVAAKQAYETRQIKDLFHGPEGRADREKTASLTEEARAPLAAAVKRAMVPVTHSLRITPL